MLKPGVILQFLDNFGLNADGDNMQFKDLNMSNKRVENIAKAMDEVTQVQKMDLSVNGIADINPLKDCVNLIKLNVSKNKIKNIGIFATDEAFPNLKWLDVSANKFTSFPAFKVPKLEYLDISYNKLEKVDEGWQTHERLRIVKCVDNKFKNLAVFKNLPALEELNMTSNMVSTLTGELALPKLRKLNLKRNKISKVEEEGIPDLPALEKLNLHGNNLPDLEVLFKLMAAFPTAVDINVTKNPVEQNATHFNLLLAEVMTKNTKIQRFCKVKIEERNKMESVHLQDYRWQVAEAKRIEEEKKAAEADAAGEN